MNILSGHSSLTAEHPDFDADETFERVFGPTDYAFQYGRAHFIVLDNVIDQRFAGMRDTGHPGWSDGQMPVANNCRGGPRAEQIEFGRNSLRFVPADDRVVLAFHIPIEGGGVHRIPEQRALSQALSSHPHTFSLSGSLSGHTHLHVDGNRYTTGFRPARRDPGHRMSVHVGEDGLITANVFNGAEGDRVTMRIVPGSTASDSRKDSHHIWHASLPTDVPAGTHVIEVVHTDLYGRTVSAHHTIRIGAPQPIRP